MQTLNLIFADIWQAKIFKMLTILLVSLALSGAAADQRRRAQVKIENSASLLVFFEKTLFYIIRLKEKATDHLDRFLDLA